MASVRKEITIEAAPEAVWAALSDWGALHLRLVPGFAVAVRLEGRDRLVTFFNGVELRERLVTLDETERRLVWSIVDPPYEHHNGVAQVFPAGPGRTRFVWTADLLPDELAPRTDAMMERGIGIIRTTLEAAASGAAPYATGASDAP